MMPPKIYGLIGYPVKHSFSPNMHNAAFQAFSINAEYKLFELKPEELEGFLLDNIRVKDVKGESFFSQDIVGFNITIPHKIKAREILEKEFPYNQNAPQTQLNLYYVKLSGAVNTVKREGNILEYWNTDATGFWKSLTQKEPLCLGFEPKGKKILLIGCGGAGMAIMASIIASLIWRNIGIQKIYINDINNKAIDSAEKHFQKLPQYSYFKDILKSTLTDDIPTVIKDCDLLINASPVGMKEGDGSVIDKGWLHSDLSVYDVVYNRKTQLIKDAKSQGLSAVNGLGMLLYQGVDAFELWTGEKAPVEVIEVMRKALTEAMSK